jgi:acyl dehydratase
MPERELTRSPSMLALFARAGVALVPGAPRLPFVAGRDGEIPARVLTMSEVAIDRDRLAAYDRLCGFAVGDRVPATYPHMLAFPLHLALMTHGDFPFAAIGLVHIANQIVQHRPIDAAERLSLRVWATGPEPHPRGIQFAIRTEARVDDALVWEETSINLRRGGGSGAEGAPAPGTTADEPPSSRALPATATWRLNGDLGRRYGAVSGDLNPIHIHPLTARLFGFPAAIAHGMWTKARCLAALAPELPGAFTVHVAFRRPILLPATVSFAEAGTDAALRFGVRDARHDTPHLSGMIGA